MVACVFANAFRKENARAFRPDEFMPQFGDEPRKSPEELEVIFRSWAAQRRGPERKGKK